MAESYYREDLDLSGMSSRYWGKLQLSREGTDKEINIPEAILLFDEQHFIGRLPNADGNKFSHSQQCVISSPYLSSTHFSIEMRHGEGDKETTFFVADYSRNGTFLRVNSGSNGLKSAIPELVGANKRLQIHPGDEIILKFKNEIKLVYTFVTNITDSQPEVESSRKRPKNNVTKEEEAGQEGVAEKFEEDKSLQLLQLVESLKEQLRAMETKKAASMAANDDLTKDLCNKDRELEVVRAKLADKNVEHLNVLDILYSVEADLNATKARLSKMTDSQEVKVLCISFSIPFTNCSIKFFYSLKTLLDNQNLLIICIKQTRMLFHKFLHFY